MSVYANSNGTGSTTAAGCAITTTGRLWSSCGSTTSGFTHASFQNGNGYIGVISTSGSVASYSNNSDYRLKENVVSLENATTRLKQLQPKRFNYITTPDVTIDGFLAHEVQPHCGEAVIGAKDAVDENGDPEYQTLDMTKLVPLLVATIKELEARIAALEA